MDGIWNPNLLEAHECCTGVNFADAALKDYKRIWAMKDLNTKKLEDLLLYLETYYQKGLWTSFKKVLIKIRSEFNMLQKKNRNLEDENNKLKSDLNKKVQEYRDLNKKMQATYQNYISSIDIFYKLKNNIEITQNMRELEELADILEDIRLVQNLPYLELILDQNTFTGYVPENIFLYSNYYLEKLRKKIQSHGNNQFYHGPCKTINPIQDFIPSIKKDKLEKIKDGSCFLYIITDKYEPERILGIFSLFDFNPKRYSKDKATDFLEHFCYIFGCTIKDVWEHQKLNREKIVDGLTGAYNRGYLNLHAPRILNFAQRKNFPVSLLFIDLDGFKPVNDTYGHRAGDNILIQVVATIKEIVRRHDIFVRLGGDEFVILIADAGYAEACRFRERVYASIQSISVSNCIGREANLTISASIGVAEYNPGQTVDDLVKEADKEMYKVKRKKK